MESDLRKLLIEEEVPLPPEEEVELETGRVTRTVPTLVFDTEARQTILTISEDGESILEITAFKRFFPPLAQYSHPTPEETESAIQERIVALLDQAVGDFKECPEVEPGQLGPFFRDRLGLGQDDTLNVYTDATTGSHCDQAVVFTGRDGWSALPGRAYGIRGKPGVIIETPRGVGLFLSDLDAVVGARVSAVAM